MPSFTRSFRCQFDAKACQAGRITRSVDSASLPGSTHSGELCRPAHWPLLSSCCNSCAYNSDNGFGARVADWIRDSTAGSTVYSGMVLSCCCQTLRQRWQLDWVSRFEPLLRPVHMQLIIDHCSPHFLYSTLRLNHPWPCWRMHRSSCHLQHFLAPSQIPIAVLSLTLRITHNYVRLRTTLRSGLFY